VKAPPKKRPRKSAAPADAEAAVDGVPPPPVSLASVRTVAERRLADVLRIEPPSPAAVQLRSSVSSVLDALSAGLVERETETRLLLLAALCGESLLLLGPPGCAKSEVARRLALVSQGTFFERLLTRFTTPEELFGPLSLKALEADRYERFTSGFLPTATVAFLDEVFRASSSVLNTLLLILNERRFDNGAVQVDVPLLCLVAASNEVPDSDELDALFDRFLLRAHVQPVSETGLTALLSAPAVSAPAPEPASPPPALDLAAIRATASAVTLPPSVITLLQTLARGGPMADKAESDAPRAKIASDRRLVKSVRLLQVAAFTSGRTEVNCSDCLLLENVLWDSPEQIGIVRSTVLQHVASHTLEAAKARLPARAPSLASLYSRAVAPSKSKRVTATLLERTREAAESLSEQARLRAVMGGFAGEPHLWRSADSEARARSALLSLLQPKEPETKKAAGRSRAGKAAEVRRQLGWAEEGAALRERLSDALSLEAALQAGLDGAGLAELLPRLAAQQASG
jgi:MoxR-like ATPase